MQRVDPDPPVARSVSGSELLQGWGGGVRGGEG